MKQFAYVAPVLRYTRTMFNLKILALRTEQQKTPYADLIARINDPQRIRADHELIMGQANLMDMLHTSPLPAVILNPTRQVIAANENTLQLLGVDSVEKLLGLRPGELLACVHGHENEHGCGTTNACSMCGAVNSVLQAQHTGKKAQLEATLAAEVNGQYTAFDFKVSASPLVVKDKTFYIVYLEDISAIKTREMYNKVFFHDIMNIMNTVQGMYYVIGSELEVMASTATPNYKDISDYLQLGQVKSQQAISLLHYFQRILQAENHTLKTLFTTINISQEIQEFTTIYNTLYSTEAITVKTEIARSPLEIYSDRLLLRQVLENMIKNACEAAPRKSTVSITLEQNELDITIQIHNASVIPEEIQLQLFKKNISTKGEGRGIGTYSMKLLAENYLQGKVWFTSTTTEGTTFYVRIPRTPMLIP